MELYTSMKRVVKKKIKRGRVSINPSPSPAQIREEGARSW